MMIARELVVHGLCHFIIRKSLTESLLDAFNLNWLSNRNHKPPTGGLMIKEKVCMRNYYLGFLSHMDKKSY